MNYIKLLRVKSWMKNGLIVVPFIFSSKFLNFNYNNYISIVIGLIAFSLMSSVVYIMNDIFDIESDRNDAHKCKRPLASGIIKVSSAIVMAVVLFIISVVLLIIQGNITAISIILIYMLLNVFYSLKLKHYPVIDITILSLFFIIRIYFGAALVDVPVSIYLTLTTLAAAYYLGVEKRRKELEANKEVRPVLERYDLSYLRDLSLMFQGLTITFYSLWVINYKGFINQTILHISIGFVIFILIYYKYLLTKTEYTNPIDIVLKDRLFLLFVLLFVCFLSIGFFI